jgi:UDP-N-acetyl-D-glucosamine dehydrogenase
MSAAEITTSSERSAAATVHADAGVPLGEVVGRLAGRRWCLGVVGLGYVGLPLLVAGLRAGLDVRGVDIDAARVAALRAGRSVVADVADIDVAVLAADRQLVDTDPQVLAGCDVVAIAVPTPLDADRHPDLSAVRAAVASVAAAIRPGTLVVLESTSYPGTTRVEVAERLGAWGWTLDVDVFVAFSPERIDPGAGRQVRTVPKLVGGVSADSTRVACAAYRRLFDVVHPVSDAAVAELAKLLENTYRAVNVALVNELCDVAAAVGVSLVEVVEAAATKPFGFAPFWPGPGVGGHCIAVDPQFLSWQAHQLGVATPVVDAAERVNVGQPQRTWERVAALVAPAPLVGVRLLAVGVAYKANVADVRESPALAVLRLAAEAGVQVDVFDPVVPAEVVAAAGFSPVLDLASARWDVVAVLCDHDVVDYGAVVAAAPVVFDARGALRRRGVAADHVVSW